MIGVGKTSLVHLIIKGSSITQPPQTVGCTVSVKVETIFLQDNDLELFFLCLISTSTSVNVLFSSSPVNDKLLVIWFSPSVFPVSLCSTLLMEILVAHQTALKVTMREISSLNFGMFQDMIDTKNVGLFSTLRLMVRNPLSTLCMFVLIANSTYQSWEEGHN